MREADPEPGAGCPDTLCRPPDSWPPSHPPPSQKARGPGWAEGLLSTYTILLPSACHYSHHLTAQSGGLENCTPKTNCTTQKNWTNKQTGPKINK